jgi:predicted amidophosphoribosyltransferase
MNNNILDLLLPNQCIVCQRISGVNLCSKCLINIPNTANLWLNNKSNKQPAFLPSLNTTLQTNLEDNHLNSILSCTDFKNHIVRKSIHYLKYKNLPQLSQPLGSVMLRALSQNLRIKENILLCPIPLHPNRIKFRGYNQSLLLTQYLQYQLKLPIYTELARIRDTPHQMQIRDKQTRIKNVTDSFEAKQEPCNNDQHIIIVDDVTTTLSTIKQAAKALSNKGFTNINALVLAH